MKNSARVSNDGICVYLDTHIVLSGAQKAILILLNLLFLSVCIIIAFALLLTKPTPWEIFVAVILIPGIYSVSLGRYTLWNLFGSEHLIINTKTIAVSRNYGLFHTPWKSYQFRKLFYNVRIVDDRPDNLLGTIEFTSHNQFDLPILIMTTSINVPVTALNELIAQLEHVFAIENLDESGEFNVNLN